jgi:predicted HNH restriction endonuclease
MEPTKTIHAPSIHIVLGNEKNGHIEALKRYAKSNKAVEWTVNSKAKDGDIVAFYIKRPISSFVAFGRVRGKPYLNTNPDSREKWPEKCLAMIKDMQILREPLHYSLFTFDNWKFSPPQSSMTVQSAYRDEFWKVLVSSGQEEHRATSNQNVLGFESTKVKDSNDRNLPGVATAIGGPEGGRRSVTVTRVERNPKNRKACIEHWKAKCQVCGFDFYEHFGSIAEGFIHVHHEHPVAVSGAIVPDPIKDMKPLCPNCHAVAHLQQPEPYSIAELITFRSEAKRGR